MLNINIDEKAVKKITLNDIKHTQYNVVQGNNLIEAMYDLNERELKVFLAIISLIGKNDNALNWYKLTTKELCALCGIPERNGKRTLNTLREGLMSKVFYMRQTVEENGSIKDVIIEYHFFRAVMFNDDFWYVRLSDDLIPFVLCLKDNFTTEKLSDVRNYNCSLAIRLDMIFTMRYKKETSKMSLENKLNYKMTVVYDLNVFRDMIMLDGKYQEFKMFNNKILKPAIDAVNEKKYFHVDMKKELNVKHQVSKIVFFVTLGERHEYYQTVSEKLAEKQQDTQMKEKITKILVAIGFSNKDIEYILKKNEIETITTQLLKLNDLDRDEKEDQKEYLCANLKTKQQDGIAVSAMIAALK